MSSLTLETFFAQPRVATHSVIAPRSDQAICFIIDQARQPNALERLYGLGQPLEQDNLYRGTEFAPLASQGPIWVTAPETSELSVLAAQLCLERNAGICLRTRNPEKAKLHAKWLLKVNDGSGGQSLISYYRPSLWAALALTAGSSMKQLIGPWLSVFSPAPKHLGTGPSEWVSWSEEHRVSNEEHQAYFTLPGDCPSAQQALGWAYWIDEHYGSFGELTEHKLHVIVKNFAFLADHGIGQGRHLLRLGNLVSNAHMDTQPEVAKILATTEAAHVKVRKLERLSTDSMSSLATGKEEWSHHGIR